MYYVYRLQSLEQPSETHIGTTRSVKKKLAMHNRGEISRTAEHAPWRVSFYAAFTRKQRAKEFAEYLSSSEGRDFGRTHLWRSSSSSSKT